MLWKIFVIALAVRWGYAIAIFALMGSAGLQSVDSLTYLFYAHEFAGHIASGSLSGWQWLGPVGDAMPLAQWVFGLCGLAFGAATALAYVLIQGIFDAGTCLLIYGIARTLNESYGAPAGIAAAVNPTQIVLSGLALTDTPFLFFITLFLFAAVYWLRTPTWRWAALIGFALGAATMIRALSAPFAVVLLLFLFAVAIAKKFFSRDVTRTARRRWLDLLALHRASRLAQCQPVWRLVINAAERDSSRIMGCAAGQGSRRRNAVEEKLRRHAAPG